MDRETLLARRFNAGLMKIPPPDSCQAIPYTAFRELFKLPRGHPVRVAIFLLAITGCRPSEPDNMNPRNIVDGWLYWHPGKGQTGTRKEYLPGWFRDEISDYRAANRVPSNRILGYRAAQLRRYFNRFVRPYLSEQWQAKAVNPLHPHRWQDGYVLKLKGLRKSFATAVYAGYVRKGYDHSAAATMTSVRMVHSDKAITCAHYLKEMDRCEIEHWLDFYESYASEAGSQVCLLDF